MKAEPIMTLTIGEIATVSGPRSDLERLSCHLESLYIQRGRLARLEAIARRVAAAVNEAPVAATADPQSEPARVVDEELLWRLYDTLEGSDDP